MAREPLPTWFFVLVVVRNQGKFLLVQEARHGGGWYLPAGRVEAGETFLQAAYRETIEEAGIPVNVTGIVRIEHTPYGDGSVRLRVVLTAIPAGDALPKSIPDEESIKAEWFTIDQIDHITLRGEEVKFIVRYVHRGGMIYPLNLIVPEGTPYFL